VALPWLAQDTWRTNTHWQRPGLLLEQRSVAVAGCCWQSRRQ